MRAFVAIDLPPAIRAALAEKQRLFRASPWPAKQARGGEGDRATRWTPPEALHLTLKFLGEISAVQSARVIQTLAELEQGTPWEPFSVALRGFGFFPDARHPRIFWAGLEAPPALPRLARQIESALEALGFAPDGRPYTPHLTLARFRTEAGWKGLEPWLEQHRDLTLGSFEVSEFFLWESKLSPQGARHQKVARFPGGTAVK